jgi:ABC-type sugar transport system ATPase subunit
MSKMAPSLMEVRSLNIASPSGSALMADVSFKVGAGEIFAVIGQSGIGKSSILNVIAGFINSTARRIHSPWHWFDSSAELEYSGDIFVDGAPIDGLLPEERSMIGMVMQGGVIYEHLSVYANITYPLKVAKRTKRDELEAEARRLLKAVELFADLDDAGIDRRLASKAGTLSGGERQRLALARTLAKNPRVFMLDEAFANLDPVLRSKLFERFSSLISGEQRCAIVVTHDLSDLASANGILLLGQNQGGPGYRVYERRADGSLVVYRDNSDGSSYWQEWHTQISDAIDR